MTIGQIRETIEKGQSLKLISQAYSEIASIRLRQIRADVEATRNFLDEISSLYAIVKQAAIKKRISSEAKLAKTVSILITSNYRFYGNVNSDITLFFLVNTVKYPTDQIIIGQAATEYLQAINHPHPYKEIILKKDLPNSLELRNLVDKIKDYERVFVYYSQLKSVLIQIPTVKDITQTYIPKFEPIKISEDFILEPEIMTMLTFFETQIKQILLEQTFLESELARTGSRLISMDEAQNKAEEFLRQQKRVLHSTLASSVNSKLLETFSYLIRRNL